MDDYQDIGKLNAQDDDKSGEVNDEDHWVAAELVVLVEGVLNHIKTVLKLFCQDKVKENCADDATDYKADASWHGVIQLVLFGIQ